MVKLHAKMVVVILTCKNTIVKLQCKTCYQLNYHAKISMVESPSKNTNG